MQDIFNDSVVILKFPSGKLVYHSAKKQNSDKFVESMNQKILNDQIMIRVPTIIQLYLYKVTLMLSLGISKTAQNSKKQPL